MTALDALRRRAGSSFRRVTRLARPLPDFLVAGEMKCGTTALYRYLLQHPQVGGSSVKEVRFFDENYRKGLDWYRQHFPISVPGRDVRVGEASPTYLFHPLAPGRIQATIPEVRIIVLLRDPVARAHSQYQHMVRRGFEPLSFEDAIAAETERLAGERQRLINDPSRSCATHVRYAYVAKGVYWRSLSVLLQRFSASQVLVLRSDELFADARSVAARTATFLELPPFEVRDVRARNVGQYPKMSPAVRDELKRYFRPHNAKLAELTGMEFDWG